MCHFLFSFGLSILIILGSYVVELLRVVHDLVCLPLKMIVVKFC